MGNGKVELFLGQAASCQRTCGNMFGANSLHFPGGKGEKTIFRIQMLLDYQIIKIYPPTILLQLYSISTELFLQNAISSDLSTQSEQERVPKALPQKASIRLKAFQQYLRGNSVLSVKERSHFVFLACFANIAHLEAIWSKIYVTTRNCYERMVLKNAMQRQIKKPFC